MVGFKDYRHRVFLMSLLYMNFLVLAGCSGSGSDKIGTVEGKVTVDGTPANSGEVVFTVNGASISGIIQADGTYRAVGVAVGDAKIRVALINTQGSNSAAMPGGAMPGGVGKTGAGKKEAKAPTEIKDMPAFTQEKPVPIPLKYSKEETSGLTYSVKSGTQTYDIPLAK